MSCFILNDEKIAGLAEYIAALYNMGFDYFGYSIPENLGRELSACVDRSGFMDSKKIYLRLFDMNATAYAGRYKEPKAEPADPAALKFPQIYKAREAGTDPDIKEWFEDIKPWHYELLKLTQCFIYQCSEDATHKEPLYIALKELEAEQLAHIISNQPDYIKAAWG